MNREEARAGIQQVDERLRQAYKRREELDHQFEEMPVERWADITVESCTRELTVQEKELMDQMERLLNQQEAVKKELYALLDEKDVLVRELCRCFSKQEEWKQIDDAWAKERREWRMRIDPEDVIDISGILVEKETKESFVSGQYSLEGTETSAISGQYAPEESEALAAFARTGNPQSLIPLEEKEWSRSGGVNGQGGNPANPLGAMVLARLTAEADVKRRGLLGRAYLKRGTLMQKSCEPKGEKLLFDGAASLDWSEFSEQGREDYENGNYERAARCLELSVDKLQNKGMDVLESRMAKQWLAEECRLLADIYLEGKGGALASPKRAAVYLEMAAEKAHDTEAAYRLGMLYVEGKGVPESPALAWKYVTMAANQGHVRAGTDLAYAMLTGKEWAKALYSEERVRSCLDAGLKNGDGNAVFYMGVLCCIQGQLDEAITWFEKILDTNAARMTLGQIYFKQGRYQTAVPLLKEGCDILGYKYCWEYTINAHAQESNQLMRLDECMGQCYGLGLGGCEKDFQKARVYLEDAVTYQGAQAQTYEILVGIYIADGGSDTGKAEKILRYWLKGQELGSTQIPINLGSKMFTLLRNSGTDGAKKGLVSRCAEALSQLKKENNPKAKYEYCAYLVNFSPHWLEGTENRWEYSDSSYFAGTRGSSHFITAPQMEQLLDEASAGGVFFALYVKGRHYLKINNTKKAYECFQRGAQAGDVRAKNELSHFKKTLLGYSYQK